MTLSFKYVCPICVTERMLTFSEKDVEQRDAYFKNRKNMGQTYSFLDVHEDYKSNQHTMLLKVDRSESLRDVKQLPFTDNDYVLAYAKLIGMIALTHGAYSLMNPNNRGEVLEVARRFESIPSTGPVFHSDLIRP